MFRISRRLDYGLQLMIALAQDEQNRPQATAVLAERLHIPLPFLHQIGRSLIQGGLIKATPGPRGGLRLNQSAGNIGLLQIIETLEGPVSILPEPNGNGNGVASRAIWEDLQRTLVATFPTSAWKPWLMGVKSSQAWSFLLFKQRNIRINLSILCSP